MSPARPSQTKRFPFRRFLSLAKFALLLFLLLSVGASIALALLLHHANQQLPPLPDLSELRPDYGTSVRSLDGHVLGGSDALAPTPFTHLPPLLIMTFLAAEDEDFFHHDGYNPRSMLRALVVNYQAGQTVQGASTITQQVAKHFVGNDRRFARKLQELLLARKLEAHFSKEEILDAYLGGVYFGQQAWGVTMASHRFFHQSPADLNLNQMATLAGVLPAPSVYNPIDGPQAARRERNRVLRRLHEVGVISRESFESEAAKPLEIPRARPPSLAPEAIGSILRRWPEIGPNADWETSNLTVYTSLQMGPQTAIRQSLQSAIEANNRRSGYHGPPARVLHPEAFDAAASQLSERTFSLGRILDVSSEGLRIQLGEADVLLPSEHLDWLNGRHPRSGRPRQQLILSDTFARDHVVLLRRDENHPEHPLDLFQFPDHEGAFLVLDHFSGDILASVGAYDVDQNQFHRAEQACRQPGSLFKTILYAEAFARDISLATLLSDLPSDIDARDGVWQPRNADFDFRGYLMAIDAFAASRNIPAVHLGQFVGHQALIARARDFGIASVLDPTPSLALGASCLRLPEVAAAYAAIPRGGLRLRPNSISFIQNQRTGQIRDYGHFLSPDSSLYRRVVRAAAPPEVPRRAVSAPVNQLLHQALRAVVTSGTAHSIPAEWPVSGKTGTSNKFDAWFAGFDPQITATVWIGSDQNDRPFLSGEHGGTVALPAFINFYAGRNLHADDWPPTLDSPDLETHRIDPRSGLLARPGEAGRELLFLRGTAPREYAPTRATRQLDRLDTLFD